MNFINKNKWKILIMVFIFSVLSIRFFMGVQKPEADLVSNTEIIEEVSENNAEIVEEAVKPSPSSIAVAEKEEKKSTKTTPVPTPEVSNYPTQTNLAEPVKTITEAPLEEEKAEPICTLAIRCDTILNNIDKVKAEKRQFIPEDGVILISQNVTFSEGETVFDVLKRELKSNNIHLDFDGTTVYDSVYIKGIANIYEFDAGNMSGWLYKVNGKVPSVGCSMYKIKDGDKIEFVYTCNMGNDI